MPGDSRWLEASARDAVPARSKQISKRVALGRIVGSPRGCGSFAGSTTAPGDPDGGRLQSWLPSGGGVPRVLPSSEVVLDETQDLMEAVGRGDATAFSALYDGLAPLVLGVCLRVLRDRAEAEEVLGDVFLDLWRRPDRYDPDRGGVAAYLVTLARTRAIDRLRAGVRRRARETEAPAPSTAAPGPGPLEGTVAGETRRHVPQAME